MVQGGKQKKAYLIQASHVQIDRPNQFILHCITKGLVMKTKTYTYGNVTVNIIDQCTNEAERRKRLEEAVKTFFLAIEKGKENEKRKNQMVERVNGNVPTNYINANNGNTNIKQVC